MELATLPQFPVTMIARGSFVVALFSGSSDQNGCGVLAESQLPTWHRLGSAPGLEVLIKKSHQVFFPLIALQYPIVFVVVCFCFYCILTDFMVFICQWQLTWSWLKPGTSPVTCIFKCQASSLNFLFLQAVLLSYATISFLLLVSKYFYRFFSAWKSSLLDYLLIILQFFFLWVIFLQE